MTQDPQDKQMVAQNDVVVQDKTTIQDDVTIQGGVNLSMEPTLIRRSTKSNV